MSRFSPTHRPARVSRARESESLEPSQPSRKELSETVCLTVYVAVEADTDSVVEPTYQSGQSVPVNDQPHLAAWRHEDHPRAVHLRAGGRLQSALDATFALVYGEDLKLPSDFKIHEAGPGRAVQA